MRGAFGPVLARLRKEAGFRSAYEFFHKSGGPRIFRVGYDQYLNLENGKSLPRPRTLVLIAQLLGLLRGGRELRELSVAYIEALVGQDAALALVHPFLAPPPQPRKATAMGAAVSKALDARRKNLSRSQAEVLFSSRAIFWAFKVLSEDKEAWREEELARLLGLGGKEIRSALERMSRTGLARKDRQGAWRCPFSGAVFAIPREFSASFRPGTSSTQDRWIDEMEKSQGATVYRRRAGFRASELGLSAYYPYLSQAVLGAEMFSSLEGEPDSAYFVVEARVRRLFPFAKPRRG